MLKSTDRIVCSLLLCAMLAACGGGGGGGAVGGGGGHNDPPPVVTLESIDVTPQSPTIMVGTTKQLNAMGTYSDGTSANITSQVTWASTDESVATISATGLATALSVTSTLITATSGTIVSSSALTVTPIPALVSVDVTPKNVTIISNGTSTQQFTATGTYSDSSTQDLTGTVEWSSSNTNLSIDVNGLATVISQGTFTITATMGGVQGSTLLTTKLPISCTYAYSDWGVCSMAKQTRTAVASPEGCVQDTVPVLEKSCQPIALKAYSENSYITNATYFYLLNDPFPMECAGGCGVVEYRIYAVFTDNSEMDWTRKCQYPKTIFYPGGEGLVWNTASLNSADYVQFLTNTSGVTMSVSTGKFVYFENNITTTITAPKFTFRFSPLYLDMPALP